MTNETTGRLNGPLFTEAAEWIWEQLQEEGVYLAGELVELILKTERELAIQAQPIADIARIVDEEFRLRGLAGQPSAIEQPMIRAVLEWEDDFLGFAGIPRAES
jgi:hypothetical protein